MIILGKYPEFYKFLDFFREIPRTYALGNLEMFSVNFYILLESFRKLFGKFVKSFAKLKKCLKKY